jgi:hypothetical protein
MGTSGAYSGSGGKAGKEIGVALGQWLDSLPRAGKADSRSGEVGPPDAETGTEVLPGVQSPSDDAKAVEFPPRLVSGALALLRPRMRSGNGGMGGSGGGSVAGSSAGRRGIGGGDGPRRSTARVSRSTGRAAAAAYAYATGDRAGLQALGLDYDSLRALGDQLAITCRIVEAACDAPNSTIEDSEERYVAAEVAEWVLKQSEAGSPPSPEEITRYAIATIIVEVISTEMGEVLRRRSQDAFDIERELHESAEILAGKAGLSVSGASEVELAKAIEDGIETLRAIYGAKS